VCVVVDAEEAKIARLKAEFIALTKDQGEETEESKAERTRLLCRLAHAVKVREVKERQRCVKVNDL
jgi:hypothetical protein